MKYKIIRTLLLISSIISYGYLATLVYKVTAIISLPWIAISFTIIGILIVWHMFDFINSNMNFNSKALKADINNLKAINKKLYNQANSINEAYKLSLIIEKKRRKK